MKTIVISEQKEIEKIIKECDICFAGFADTDGTPYVLPMNFGYEDGLFYLHSAQEGRSISILEKNPKICLTFSTNSELTWQNKEIACSYRMRGGSVVCEGLVQFEEDYDKRVHALDVIMRQYSNEHFCYNSPSVKNVKVWIVTPSKICGKKFGVPYKS